MIEFKNPTVTAAVSRLEKEKASVKGQKEQAMAGPVVEALKSFCQQDETFAKAVTDGGSFAECMKTVAKNVTTHISDLDAYKRAVNFYLPKADISMQLSITNPVDAKEAKPSVPLTLTLDDLFN